MDVFNVVQDHFTPARIRPLKTGTSIILVYDTDKNNIAILEDNIRFLKRQKAIRDIICVPQVNNLEDELVFSCNIKQAKDLTGSSTTKDFKRDLLACSNLDTKLEKNGFSTDKFWSRTPRNAFSAFSNGSTQIKIS